MKTNRRQFIKSTATAATVAATTSIQRAEGANPFAPADPALTAKWFDKNKQHQVPKWAFTDQLIIPPTPRAKDTATWESLAKDKDRDPFGDGKEVGEVLHGVAAEWNGELIGGNGGQSSAWEAMRKRVTPEVAASEYGINELGNWGRFGDQTEGGLVRCYKIEMREALVKLRQDAKHDALVYTYAGMTPGPTFKLRHGLPCVVRFSNKMQTEASIHHHGGHTPAHSDGFPNFYVLQDEARDYLYPNILPVRLNGNGKTELDFGEGQSTTWYHDHALDATAYNVSKGLAGFTLWFDDLELKLLNDGVLPGLKGISNSEITISTTEFKNWFDSWRSLKDSAPTSKIVKDWESLLAKAGVSSDPLPEDANLGALTTKIDSAAKDPEADMYHKDATDAPGVGTPYFNPYEIPIVLQDRVIDQDTGQIVYDSDGHNGYIGNTQLISGVAWPVKTVKRRKYRLRILDGSNSRIYRLRFLDDVTLGLKEDEDGFLAPAKFEKGALEKKAMDFLRIGKDSWLWPTPQKRKSLILNMANRADLIVDFAAYYKAAADANRLVTIDGKKCAIYYMVNTMPQKDGRGPKSKLNEDAGDPTVFPLPFELNGANPVVAEMNNKGVIPDGFLGSGTLAQLSELNQPIALMKYIIEPDVGEGEEATIDENTIMRPRHAIPDEEVMAVREFVFERGKGAWMLNGRFYDPTLANATPVNGIKGRDFKVPSSTKDETKPSLLYAEEWILRNGGGGWWHPIHIHLEGHQLVAYEKDFEADGLIDGDGLLGARAQAKMAKLPDWDRLVGEFGLDTLNAEAAVAAIKRALIDPTKDDLSEEFKATANALDVVLASRNPGVSLFPELRKGPTISQSLEVANAGLQNQINGILDALDELRLQWAGEMVGNHDTQALGPNTIARIRMRFRTFTGPVVFHCHNVEHEDMRMMFNLEPMLTVNNEGTATNPNTHDPNISPAARTHGQDVTDLKTNPNAVGELPWETIDGLPHWGQAPIPLTDVDKAGAPIIKPRNNRKS